MFINFDMFGNTYDVIFEQYVGNSLVNSQRAQIPQHIIPSQFMQFAQWVAQSKEPRKIKMARYETIWDKFENKQKIVEYSIEMQNWEDEE